MVIQKVAITSFVDNQLFFADETNQMTLSGKDLDKKFTFVIFAHPEIFNKIKKRHNVLVYKYLPPEDKYYEDYKYAKSLEFLESNKNILNQYTHLIKTDTDVFFTNNLNSHTFDDQIYFAEGKYSTTDKCIEETYELAKIFNYEKYQRLFQISSTLFGPTDDIIEIMNESDALCKKIFYHLCSDSNYGKTISEVWGKSLYAGTSTLIATEIVICSNFSKDRLSLINSIDANCFSTEDITGIYHIHQWHGDKLYSKFKARDGEYNNLIALNDNTISDYCLDIYLKNKKELKKSIFVLISSYRDFELKPTILDMIDNSSGLYDLHFGIHVSYLDQLEIDIPDIPNIKYVTSKIPENIGVGMGRYLASQFYSGEDYYFQCDSHSRFVKNWDKIAIDSILLYQNNGIKKPLLTMYPANYWYKDMTFSEIETDQIDPSYKTNISFHEKPEDFKNLRIPSQMAVDAKGNIFTKSVSAGCIFTVGPFMSPNKDMAFWGEEIMIAARAYTHGYDLVVPSEQFIYHLYYNSSNPDINRRKIFWQDFPKEFEIMNKKSRDIIYKILTQGLVGDGLLGTERTLNEYGVFAGLDFTSGQIVNSC
jgi:hypothetical protein